MRFDFDAEYLRSILEYYPETGTWRWLVHAGCRKRGDPAGCNQPLDENRRVIRVKKHAYYSAVLACLYMTGKWPKNFMDHRNRKPWDDRWANLREATKEQNRQNTVSRNKHGKGVVEVKKKNPNGPEYVAMIRIGKEKIILGRYKDKKDAANAYIEAAKKYYGEFARW